MRRVRTSVPRSRVPWHRRAFLDPAALRYWLAMAAVAVVLSAAVHRSLASAEAIRSRWGPTTEVLVTTEAVRAGDPLGPATAITRWPSSLAPTDALTAAGSDDRAAADLDAGIPVTAALVRDGSRARVTERHIAIEAVNPGVEPGDRVDIWATVDPTLGADTGDGTSLVARSARVVRAANDLVILAVETKEVGDLTQAIGLAQLTVVIVP